MSAAADQQQMDYTHEEEEYDGAEGEEDERDREEEFKNNHDLIGVDGIITAQKNEIDGKKVSQPPIPIVTSQCEIS